MCHCRLPHSIATTLGVPLVEGDVRHIAMDTSPITKCCRGLCAPFQSPSQCTRTSPVSAPWSLLLPSFDESPVVSETNIVPTVPILGDPNKKNTFAPGRFTDTVTPVCSPILHAPYSMEIPSYYVDVDRSPFVTMPCNGETVLTPKVSDESESDDDDDSDVSENGDSDGPSVVGGDVWLSELSTCLNNTKTRSVRPNVRAPKDVSSDNAILEALSAKVSLLNVLAHIIIYAVVVDTLLMYPLSSFQSK